MVKCIKCGVKGGIDYGGFAWHDDLAHNVLICKETGKCYGCINEENGFNR